MRWIRGTIRGVLRFLLPEPLLAVRRRYRTLRRIGHSKSRALRAILTLGTTSRLSALNAEFLPSHLWPVDVAVDVGAFQGRYSEALVRLLAPARVFAFEPSPASFLLARKRLSRYPSVQLAPLAVADARGRRRLQTYLCANGDSLCRMDPEVQSHYTGAPRADSAALRTGEAVVDTATLDELFPREAFPEISLVKVDVQGAESAVISGGQDALRRTRVLMIEALFEPHYEGAALFFDLHPRLLSLGFRLYTICPPWRGVDGRALHTDAIYVRNEPRG